VNWEPDYGWILFVVPTLVGQARFGLAAPAEAGTINVNAIASVVVRFYPRLSAQSAVKNVFRPLSLILNLTADDADWRG
jgi:hypothetical protein